MSSNTILNELSVTKNNEVFLMPINDHATKRDKKSRYPPSYPKLPLHNYHPSWKSVPLAPNMTITNVGNIVTLTWSMKYKLNTSKIKMYELYVCQETEEKPDTTMWKKLGNIKAIQLPMFCEIGYFDSGYTYHFILRAVDIHNRRAPFALQQISL